MDMNLILVIIGYLVEVYIILGIDLINRGFKFQKLFKTSRK